MSYVLSLPFNTPRRLRLSMTPAPRDRERGEVSYSCTIIVLSLYTCITFNKPYLILLAPSLHHAPVSHPMIEPPWYFNARRKNCQYLTFLRIF